MFKFYNKYFKFTYRKEKNSIVFSYIDDETKEINTMQTNMSIALVEDLESSHGINFEVELAGILIQEFEIELRKKYKFPLPHINAYSIKDGSDLHNYTSIYTEIFGDGEKYYYYINNVRNYFSISIDGKIYPFHYTKTFNFENEDEK